MKTQALQSALKLLLKYSPDKETSTPQERREFSKIVNDIETALNKAENLHIFKVKILSRTETKPSRIGITSERFHKRTSVTYYSDKFDSSVPDTIHDRAAIVLRDEGFNIVGISEGIGCMYVLSDTFKEPFVKS